MSRIEPQPGILEIKLYESGKSQVDGVSNVVKLSSNENPFGPSPAAQDAIRRTLHELHRYPAVDQASLREAIGAVHGLDPDRIVCGVGSDEVITFLCQAYAGPGDEVLYTEHGFSMYKISTLAVGATPVVAPEIERRVDAQSVLDTVTPKTRLVFITNPGNPTGTMLNTKELEVLARDLPESCLLVLDGAYAEFADGFDGGASLVEAYDNVVMTRTFSKLYGLGGLRVGWGYGPRDVIDVLNRVRGPFNLSVPAMAAAEAAVRDFAFVERCQSENARLRRLLVDTLGEHGVDCDESFANFVLARFDSAETADGCYAHLLKNGLIVRQVGGYGFPEALRITVGDEPSVRRVAHCVGQFMAGRS